jgi:hypothetical protein
LHPAVQHSLDGDLIPDGIRQEGIMEKQLTY